MTLKYGQGHQIQNDSVDPKQGYNQAKLEQSHFNGVWEKADVKNFWNEEICKFSSLITCESQRK